MPSDEDIEVSSGGNLKPGQPYKCKNCKTLFRTNTDVGSCPGCNEYMVADYNCTEYDGEVVEKSKQDEFEAAADEDKTLEQPRPDPKKSEIPISKNPQKNQNKGLKDMFMKVFGGGGAK